MKSTILVLILSCFLLPIFGSTSASSISQISGSVANTEGIPVEGAAIRIRNKTTGITYITI